MSDPFLEAEEDEEDQRHYPEDQQLRLRPTEGGLSPPSQTDEEPNKRRFKDIHHAWKILESLNSMRNSSNLTDVQLISVSEGTNSNLKPIRAHKAVLSARSPYFRAMFDSRWDEGESNQVIKIELVSPESLEMLVDYVYTSEITVDEENVQSLLPAANVLQLTDVRDFCCEFLLGQLHPSNCLGINRFADIHGCIDLVESTHKYIEGHFTEVLDSEEFLCLEDPKMIIPLISSNTITVSGEEKILESVLAWVNHDLDKRCEYLSKLIEHVRLPLLDPFYLLSKVEESRLVKDSSECKDFIIEALKYHLYNLSSPVDSSLSSLKSFHLTLDEENPRLRPREPAGLPKVLLAIGGQAPKAVRSVECFDFKLGKWLFLSEMISRRCRCGVAVVKGKVYGVGGFNGSLRVKSVEEFDIGSDTWRPAPTMESRRSTLGVAVLNDRIYAVGGFDGSSGLNTAEVLDLSSSAPQPSVWRSIACMSTRRSSVGVGVLNGLIYAVGGYDGNSRQCLSSVEVYHPEKNYWSSVRDMSARRSGAGVGVLDDLLYAIGGHDGPFVRKSVERYCEEAQTWTSIADMNHCRRNAGVVTYNGLLYVVGGDDGTSNLRSMEYYNPKNDSWTVLDANLILGRSYTGFCVIDKPADY
ncbi:kelch-like protein 3 [Lepeophtheirus salmonis]|uniref:kelch-like protein 3 n=1 Tax=Lepeophtheirus salmonis TaxID=72036 RepID=UPI001AE91ABF|nr:kelch-like protein 3 [Lepeophtheirus salmonis]